MYNLLVSANREAWTGEAFILERHRVFEHTVDQVRQRFEGLKGERLVRLYSLPAIFAYEDFVGQAAKIGRIERVCHRGREIRIEYTLADRLPGIEPEMLKRLAWELDIGEWELNRTHWAVKDIDLADVLVSAELVTETQISALPDAFSALFRKLPAPEPLTIRPTIFKVPHRGIERNLVSVMMSLQPAFTPVYETIKKSCSELKLICQRADEIWEEPEILNDIFSLIFRSKVVVCDFSERNSNVFYEAGIAHTLGRTVIPLVQNPEDIPFDLRQHRHIKYLNNGEGLAALEEQLTPRLQWLTEQRR